MGIKYRAPGEALPEIKLGRAFTTCRMWRFARGIQARQPDLWKNYLADRWGCLWGPESVVLHQCLDLSSKDTDLDGIPREWGGRVEPLQ
jgi:hypothetical protein